jgi:hypothetical protein
MPGIWESGNHPTLGASCCVFGTPRAALNSTLYSALPDPPTPFMAKVLRSDMHNNSTVRGRKLKFRWPIPLDTSHSRAEIPVYDPAMNPDEEYLYTEWLSEGQWYKVAMAWAFMRIREAELLILDELSSALDPQAESCSRL